MKFLQTKMIVKLLYYIFATIMNPVLSITISFFISISLLGAEMINSYGFMNDLLIELHDTNEENPTEDNVDSELELEVNVPDDGASHRSKLDVNTNPLNIYLKLSSRHCKDIPSPPPDLS